MITLTGITWDHVRGRGPLEATAPIYAEQHGVRVEWTARSLKDFGDAPIAPLAQQYDLIVLDHPHIGISPADNGPLLALDRCLDEQTLESLAADSAGPSHASYTLDGYQWGLAVDAAMQTSALRSDLAGAAVPADWDAAVRFGDDLARAGSARLAMPLAACDAVCSFISICAGLGGMDRPGERFADPEIGAAALDILARLAEVADPRSFSWNPIRMLDHMSEHDDVAYCPLTFCYTNYSRDGFRPRMIEFGPIPAPSGSILGGAGIAVSSSCEHPRQACDYAAWLCGRDVQRGPYVEHGGQPGNRVAWTDRRANELTSGFFDRTLGVLERAHVRPRHAGWPAFQESAGVRIRRMLMERGEPGACLSQLEDDYRRSLEADAAR